MDDEPTQGPKLDGSGAGKTANKDRYCDSVKEEED
jgi:hypothetical protein